jgi:hypothetical protein
LRYITVSDFKSLCSNHKFKPPRIAVILANKYESAIRDDICRSPRFLAMEAAEPALVDEAGLVMRGDAQGDAIDRRLNAT